MKLKHILAAALFTCGASTASSAQTGKSAIVDSVNKQMQRSAKPEKSPETAVLKTNTAAAKSNTNTSVKPARIVAVPAITSQTAAASAKVARAATASDSVAKLTPPVRRAAKVAKTKPPAR